MHGAIAHEEMFQRVMRSGRHRPWEDRIAALLLIVVFAVTIQFVPPHWVLFALLFLTVYVLFSIDHVIVVTTNRRLSDLHQRILHLEKSHRVREPSPVESGDEWGA